MFERLYRQGRRFHGTSLVLRTLPAQQDLLPRSAQACPPSDWRCGVVVSGKVSRKAVERNSLRRLFQRHLLQHPPRTSHPLWLLISLRPGSLEVPPHELLRECSELFRKAGLTA